MPHDIQSRLSAAFDDSDIEWRLQWSDDEKGSGIAVPYVTNRAIQNRLDEVVGVGNWKNEYIPWHRAVYTDSSKNKKEYESQICGLSIYFEDRKEWVTKYDGAEDSDIEPIKGGLSDSMKRAAVHWGIGRYLYSMDTVFVDVEKRGRTTVIKKSSQGKLNEAHQRTVEKMFKTNPSKAAPPPVKNVTPQSAPAAPKPTPQPKPAPAPMVRHPSADLPPTDAEGSYCVMSAVVQPAMSGQNTLLQLKGGDGNTILAYMKGTNPAIIPGVWLENAVISQKLNQGVVFHTLDSFNLAAQRAA